MVGPVMMTDGIWVVYNEYCVSETLRSSERNLVHFLSWECPYRQMSWICIDLVLLFMVHEVFKKIIITILLTESKSI